MKPRHSLSRPTLWLLAGTLFGFPTGRADSQEENRPLPPEAQGARTAYEAERRRHLVELDETYLEQLGKILEKYSRAGNVDATLAIRREMDRIREELEEFRAPAEGNGEGQGHREPGITVPEDRPVNITIKASAREGVVLEKVEKGDQIILQYVSGKWKSHGQLATENPDSLAISHGEENRLAIYSKKSPSSRLRPLAVVPPQTQMNPFVFTLPSDYHQILLRIHEDPDGLWPENPGSVVYRVQLKKKKEP